MNSVKRVKLSSIPENLLVKEAAGSENKDNSATEVKEALAGISKTFEDKTEALQKSNDAMQVEIKNLNAAIRRAAGGEAREEDDEKAKNVKAHTKAYASYFRKGLETGLAELEEKALSIGSDPDGGYTVPDATSNRIVERIFETSPMRSVAASETISTQAVDIMLDDGEFDFGWVGETQSRPDTANSQLGKIRIDVHEIYAQPTATQQLLDDNVFNIENWIATKVSSRFARAENTAFITGNGVDKPRGILTYANRADPEVYERNTLERTVIGAGTAITADGLITMQGTLFEEFQNTAVWFMKRATWTQVRLLKDNENRYLVGDGSLNGSPTRTLLGRPVIFADDMPAVATAALSVAYGDFGEGYMVVDRMGIRTLRDPFTNKPFVKFYTTKRTGGAVINFQSIKLGTTS